MWLRIQDTYAHSCKTITFVYFERAGKINTRMYFNAHAQKSFGSLQRTLFALIFISNREILTSALQGGETDLIRRIDSDVTNMNTISKGFIATPWEFKCPLACPVQNNK